MPSALGMPRSRITTCLSTNSADTPKPERDNLPGTAK
jgi:hypothetical protein